jgi:hypothetical protein
MRVSELSSAVLRILLRVIGSELRYFARPPFALHRLRPASSDSVAARPPATLLRRFRSEREVAQGGDPKGASVHGRRG